MCPVPPDEAIETRLHVWPVGRFATLREAGSPHLIPVVFFYGEGALWIPVDGKPKRDRELQRVRNLRRDPRATLLLDEYRDDWSELWWIHIEGRAAICQSDDPRFARASDGLRAKYRQYEEWPLFRGEPTLIAFAPERRNAWCAEPGRWEQSGG